nr:hypothetical protein [Tanacetum cinerariifolium]
VDSLQEPHHERQRQPASPSIAAQGVSRCAVDPLQVDAGVSFRLRGAVLPGRSRAAADPDQPHRPAHS